MSSSAPAIVPLRWRAALPVGAAAVASLLAALIAIRLSVLALLIVVAGIVAVTLLRMEPMAGVIVICFVRGSVEGLVGTVGINVGGVGIDPADALNVAFLLGAVWWLLSQARAGRVDLFQVPLLPSAVAFGAMATFSLIYSVGFVLGAKDLGKLATVFAAYMVVVTYVPSKKQIKGILIATVAGSVLPMLVAIYQFINTQGYNFESHGGLRIQSVFSHPNTYGLYLIEVALAAWVLRSMVPPGLKRRAVDFMGVAAVASQALPLSRTAWIVGGLVVAAVSFKHPKLLLLVGVACAALAVAVPRTIVRVLDTFEVSEGFAAESSLDIRLGIWSGSLGLWAQHPIIGSGWGSFEALTQGFVHNDYLRVLVEVGLLGSVAFLALAFGLLKLAFRSGFGRSGFPLAFLGLAIGYLVAGFITNTFEKTPYQWYFWIFAGLAYVWRDVFGEHVPEEGRARAAEPAA